MVRNGGSIQNIRITENIINVRSDGRKVISGDKFQDWDHNIGLPNAVNPQSYKIIIRIGFREDSPNIGYTSRFEKHLVAGFLNESKLPLTPTIVLLRQFLTGMSY